MSTKKFEKHFKETEKIIQGEEVGARKVLYPWTVVFAVTIITVLVLKYYGVI
ncbi:MAG: hypothetical protein NUV61_03945 [Candidatus Azambacteria bacterium]|nr:hypothetical protein [Candidatus Azambacteria bacterium]